MNKASKRALEQTDANDIHFLESENTRLRSIIQRVITWLDGLAAQSDEQAKDTRFQTQSDACAADAKNYRATADSLRRTLATPQ
jgi:hypothetical protein